MRLIEAITLEEDINYGNNKLNEIYDICNYSYKILYSLEDSIELDKSIDNATVEELNMSKQHYINTSKLLGYNNINLELDTLIVSIESKEELFSKAMDKLKDMVTKAMHVVKQTGIKLLLGITNLESTVISLRHDLTNKKEKINLSEDDSTKVKILFGGYASILHNKKIDIKLLNTISKRSSYTDIISKGLIDIVESDNMTKLLEKYKLYTKEYSVGSIEHIDKYIKNIDNNDKNNIIDIISIDRDIVKVTATNPDKLYIGYNTYTLTNVNFKNDFKLESIAGSDIADLLKNYVNINDVLNKANSSIGNLNKVTHKLIKKNELDVISTLRNINKLESDSTYFKDVGVGLYKGLLDNCKNAKEANELTRKHSRQVINKISMILPKLSLDILTISYKETKNFLYLATLYKNEYNKNT